MKAKLSIPLLTVLAAACAEPAQIPVVYELPADYKRLTQHDGWNNGSFDTLYAIVDTVYIGAHDSYRHGRQVRISVRQWVGDTLFIFGDDSTRYRHFEPSYEGIMHWIDTAIHDEEIRQRCRKAIERNRTIYPTDSWHYPLGPPQEQG